MHEDDRRIDLLVNAVKGIDQMEQTQSYISRGCCFSSLEDNELLERWAEATRAWYRSFGASDSREADDLSAEIKLRKLAVPNDRLSIDLEIVRREMERNFERGRPEFRRRIRDIFEAMDKPPN